MSLNESGQQVYNLEVLELHCCEKNFKSDTTERTVRHAAVTRARNKIEFLISTKDVKKTVCLTPSTSSSRLTLYGVFSRFQLPQLLTYRVLPTKLMLTVHLNVPVYEEFPCDICIARTCKNLADLDRHMKEEHPKNVFSDYSLK